MKNSRHKLSGGTFTAKQISEAVKNSTTYAGIARFLGYKINGGEQRRELKRVLLALEIDYSNLTHKPSPIKTQKRYTHDEVFCINYTITGTNVKARVIKHKLIPYECEICKNPGMWNNKILKLILDHINGNSFDHHLSNLRFLCPNCNAQQPTFCNAHNHGYGYVKIS